MVAIANPPTVSAIILTKNEATNLSRCIASLRWCKEIVVLDSGSLDGTQGLAMQMGARVFTHHPHPPFNFADQRNWALEHCALQGTWVLFVDADEVIPVELARAIQEVCSAGDTLYNAYELTPRYLYWGKWLRRTQGYPNWHARLLKRGEVVFMGGVWEHFAPGARVGRIKIPYDHYANSKGLSDWLERHDRYSSWEAKRVFDFLETGNASALGTQRKLRLRLCAARIWPLRPFLRFSHMYILRLGFLEGIPALVFCFLYTIYEFMIMVKIVELRRQKAKLPL